MNFLLIIVVSLSLMNNVFGEEPMMMEEKGNVIYVTPDEKSGIVYTNKSVIVPATSMETFTVTNKVPVTETLIKEFTRPVPVTEIVTFTQKVPVTEIIPIEVSTTTMPPTTSFYYTKKVPVTAFEVYQETSKVPVTEVIVKNFTRPIPVTEVITYTQKVPVTEIIPITTTQAPTTTTTPTTTSYYTKKVPVTEFEVYQVTSKVPVTEVIVKNFTRPIPVTEVVTYSKVVPVTKVVQVASTEAPLVYVQSTASPLVYVQSTASPMVAVIPVKACRPTVCFGNDDCGSSGQCVGAFVGTCNCAACINAINCFDDASCGGLRGSCDLASHRCNCIKGYAMNGFPSLTAAIQQFCHKKLCSSSASRQDCYGLPCTMGRCVCH